MTFQIGHLEIKSHEMFYQVTHSGESSVVYVPNVPTLEADNGVAFICGARQASQPAFYFTNNHAVSKIFN